MADSNTIRILSLDGGGMRGYISATFLKLFVQEWGINPNEIWKYFDFICGTSVGGIQALGYANGMSADQLIEFFVNDGPYIFTTNPNVPSVQATTLNKITTMVFGGSFYPNNVLLEKLDEVFGAKVLLDMKTNVLVPSYNFDTNTPVFFSNVSIPGCIGSAFLAKDVSAATSAAPLYFPSYNFNNNTYIDGGVCQNNPSEIGLTLAKILKPQADRYCVLSVGTGLDKVGFDEDTLQNEIQLLRSNPNQTGLSPLRLEQAQALDTLGAFDNMKIIMSLIEIGIAAPQEIVSKDLQLQDDYTLQSLFSYRMQYYLDENQDADLDNSSQEFIDYMEYSATEYFNNDITNITNFLAHLTV